MKSFLWVVLQSIVSKLTGFPHRLHLSKISAILVDAFRIRILIRCPKPHTKRLHPSEPFIFVKLDIIFPVLNFVQLIFVNWRHP